MISLEKHGRCRGLRVPCGKNQVEIWFCPVGEKIAAHVHDKIDSTIVQIWGSARWTVGEKSRDVFGPIRKRVRGGFGIAAAHIPIGVRHAFEGRSFCIFLNIEKCDGERVSASRDFIPVP